MQPAGQSPRFAVNLPTPPQTEAPRSCWELFHAFAQIALQSFGGALAMMERVIVQQRRWMTPQDFLGVYAISQVMPGPTGISFCVLLGDRHFGLRGAAAALAGFVGVPAAIVLVVAALFGHFQHLPWVQGALHGMGAASVGLIVHTALRMARTLKGQRSAILIALAAFSAVALAHWPVSTVVLSLGVGSVLLAWRALGAGPPAQGGRE